MIVIIPTDWNIPVKSIDVLASGRDRRSHWLCIAVVSISGSGTAFAPMRQDHPAKGAAPERALDVSDLKNEPKATSKRMSKRTAQNSDAHDEARRKAPRRMPGRRLLAGASDDKQVPQTARSRLPRRRLRRPINRRR
jgi:hypothetical protein